MKYPKRNKKENDVFKQTAKEIKQEGKIPRAVLREMKDRAKTESGGRGVEAKDGATTFGTLLRKIGKSQYGLKKVGQGSYRGIDEKPTPPKKPTLEEVGVIASRNQSIKGLIARSKEYTHGTKEKQKEDLKSALKDIGSPESDAELSKTDVGEKEFVRNGQKIQEYESETGKYERGERTKKQAEKDEELSKKRTAYIRSKGGNVRKGEKALKKVLLNKMKEEYKKNKYKSY